MTSRLKGVDQGLTAGYEQDEVAKTERSRRRMADGGVEVKAGERSECGYSWNAEQLRKSEAGGRESVSAKDRGRLACRALALIRLTQRHL